MEQRVELAAPNETDGELRRRAGRCEDRLDAVQWDQLADKQAREGLARSPAGPEEALLGADEADVEPLAREVGEPCEVRRVGPGVGDDEVGRAERAPVDRGERACREGAGTKAPSVGNERVRERHERIEDDRAAPSGAPGRGQVEMPGVADDQRVELGPRRPQEAHFGERETRRGAGPGAKALPAALPDADMTLDHFDARPSQTRDHLRVPRVVPLVGAEIEGPHHLRHLVL